MPKLSESEWEKLMEQPLVDMLTGVTMLRTTPDILISAWWEKGYLPNEQILCIRQMQIGRPDKTFRLHPIEAVALVKVIREMNHDV